MGGVPPLGYDVDRSTMKLIINEKEAEAVRLIFSMYLEGQGYGKIIDKLNFLNYKTKRGNPFGKNSLHEILRNEKYTGTYIYNRTSNPTGKKYNRHKLKSDDEIIRVENMHPAIISKEDFERISLKMADNKKNASSHTAKEVYLLSGKVFCGECGSKYVGINRAAHDHSPQYIGYRCSRKNGSLKCKNSEIRREALELFVLDKLANYLFSDEMSERLYKGHAVFFFSKTTGAKQELERVRKEIDTLSKDVEKLIDLMLQTNSAAMADKLEEKEAHREKLREREEELNHTAFATIYPKSFYTKAIKTARKRLAEGKLQRTKDIIKQFVEAVTVYRDRISVTFNFDGTETETTAVNAKTPHIQPVRGHHAAFLEPRTNQIIDTANGRGRRN